MIEFTKMKLTSMFKGKQWAAYQLARTFLGLKEIVGSKHEKKILEFFAEVGHSWVKDDETAWCAAFVGAMLERSGLTSTKKLNARSYLDWGSPVEDWNDIREGDVVVFWRGKKDAATGHVAFFVRFDKNGDFIVLGGNQSNMVNEQAYAKERVLSVRRYKE